MSILKAAIIGCGHFGQRHAQHISELKDELQLVACCDIDEAKARMFSETYTAGRAAIYSNHHKMFDETSLDVVFICLPPFAHRDEVEQAAANGVHILIEKPIALTSEAAWRMVEVSEQAGIKTQVGFMFRFGTAIEELKRLLDAGDTGPVGLMSTRYFCNALHSPWWRDRSKSGGQLVEQVIHMFDLMRYVMGEPEAVFSRQENLFHRALSDYTVEDVSATVVHFRSGALAVVYATNGAIPNKWINDYRLVAQRLTAEFTDANNAVFYHTNEPERPPTHIESARNYYIHEIQDLLNAIRTDGITRTPMREGAKSLDLVLAANQSAEQGAEVKL
ncbi:MAG: Gfo/Idh/MocA family oxidoreductase [Anaerolineae bacterium]|nr:Gfo/Idh/MocA family oxidoreductase [Anaerolineae bacterium]MCA9895775.1 Gfo/Idh/MocA family oxidoreductase [Anaerolineae bacterium]